MIHARTRIARAVAVAAFATSLTLGGTVSAFANTALLPQNLGTSAALADGNDDTPGAVNTDPPVDPTETLVDAPTDDASATVDPAIPGFDCTPGPGHTCPNRGCDVGSWFTPGTLYGNYHAGVGATQLFTNTGGGTTSHTFTSPTTGTVGISYTGTLTTSYATLVATANSAWGTSLTTSKSASAGNKVTVSLGSGMTGHASYGVWRKKFTGTAYRQNAGCNLYSSSVTAYAPYAVGWYVWSS